MTVTADIVVEHEAGLHARPASVFVRTASEFDAEVTVTKPGVDKTANAKSSIGVMSLGVETGETIEIAAEGPDAERAVGRLVELVENDFETEEEPED